VHIASAYVHILGQAVSVAPYPRDLLGYRGKPPAWKLPGGAKVAVSMVVNFEEGAELSAGDGDPSSERLGEIVSIIPAGTWDQGTEQIFAYGMRAGVWRFLDGLERHNRKITFYMCGRAVERAPEIARRIVEVGHEPACHGWLWRPQSAFESEAAEREDFDKCIAASLKATGQRPLGFFSRGSESRWTRTILRDLDFAYASNGLDDDLPYWDRTDPARPLLVLPYAFDSNDMKFSHPNGFVTADEMVAYVRDALEVLVAEGEAGFPRMLNIGWHLRIAGRPGRFAAFKRILQLLDGYGDKVWVARRIDIAQSWREQFPA
jgi:peptidoglycan/xylan/chitin deacetylase (PgdA/CDA1 family)